MASSGLKFARNPFSAGASPQTPLEELMTLPQTPSRMGGDVPFPRLFPSTTSATWSRRLRLSAPRLWRSTFKFFPSPLAETIFPGSSCRQTASAYVHNALLGFFHVVSCLLYTDVTHFH